MLFTLAPFAVATEATPFPLPAPDATPLDDGQLRFSFGVAYVTSSVGGHGSFRYAPSVKVQIFVMSGYFRENRQDPQYAAMLGLRGTLAQNERFALALWGGYRQGVILLDGDGFDPRFSGGLAFHAEPAPGLFFAGTFNLLTVAIPFGPDPFPPGPATLLDFLGFSQIAGRFRVRDTISFGGGLGPLPYLSGHFRLAPGFWMEPAVTVYGANINLQAVL